MSKQGTPLDPQTLVDQFVDDATRWEAFLSLQELGETALPAVLNGLQHANWQVRRWSTIFLDHHADPESLEHLLPLLNDPKSNVRMWAVHSISCDRCKEHDNPIDVVPLLIERIEEDESIRVRRMATAMLASRPPDARTVPVFQALLQEEDRKLRLHAENGLQRCRKVGLVRD